MLKLLDYCFSRGKYLFHHLLPLGLRGDFKFLDCFSPASYLAICWALVKNVMYLKIVCGTPPNVFIHLKPVLWLVISVSRPWLICAHAADLHTHGEEAPSPSVWAKLPHVSLPVTHSLQLLGLPGPCLALGLTSIPRSHLHLLQEDLQACKMPGSALPIPVLDASHIPFSVGTLGS